MYGELLKEADPDGFGAVSGDVAVKFFERTKLPPDVLGQVRVYNNGVHDSSLQEERYGKSQIPRTEASLHQLGLE